MDNNVCEPILDFEWKYINCGEVFWYKTVGVDELWLGYKCWCPSLCQDVLVNLNTNDVYTDIDSYIIVSKVDCCLVENNEY